MMGEHKMRIADVARETGLSRVTVTLLYKETAQKVDLEAIEQMCSIRLYYWRPAGVGAEHK
jgi:putative transcriptional regulator